MRDCGVVLLTHTVWVLLAVLLTLSLLGAAADTSAGLGQVSASLARTVTGDNVWLAAVTILDQALLGLSYGWLWAGLYFVLVTITAVTSLYGYVEVIASSFADIKPSLLRWKPLAVVVVIALLFLMALSLATRAGLHIYHLVLTYVSTWPCLLISLLTLASATLSHGTRHLMKDMADLSKVTIKHVF